MIIDQTFRNIGRIREIAAILSKYGFEEFVGSTPLRSVVPDKRRLSWKKERAAKKYNRWELMRMAAEELGPTYIKLAQTLSNRPDLLPDALIEELQKLQNDVAPMEYHTVEEIMEYELGGPISESFEEFYKKPIGSASIGQVHRARLKNGENVVVKVQRPGLLKTVQTDLDILKTMVRWGRQQLENQGFYGANEVVETFERSLLRELDYNTEARFMEQFANYYKKNNKFHIPKVYKKLSTSKILVQEFIRGTNITDTETLRRWGVDTKKLAERGVDIYMSQIFEHGYFHADPHPGNILVKDDGTICLIDFGMVGKLSKKDRHAFANILIAVAREDAGAMARALKKLALDTDIEDERSFEAELSSLIDDYAGLDVAEMDIRDITNRLQGIIRNNRLRMPPGIFIIIRAITLLDGIGRAIHPQFKTFEALRPYGAKLLREIYSPGNILEDALTNATHFYDFIKSFPTEVKAILEKTRAGTLSMGLHNYIDETVVDKLNRTANRIALAVVTMGIYIASAVVLLAYSFYEGPYSLFFFVLAMIGLGVASFFTFAMLFSSWWNR